MPEAATTAAVSPPVERVAAAAPAAAPAVSPDFQRLLNMEHQPGVFSNPDMFKHAQRVATMLTESQLAPKHFQGPENLGSAVIAVDMAFRLGMNPLMVMQQLYVVHGKPGWSAQFVIAVINASKKFSPLRFRYVNNGSKKVTFGYTVYDGSNKVRKEGEETIEDWECIAYAKDLESGEILESTPVNMELAVREGWFGKADSKWRTMPRQMMTYRAASFWGRIYAPELMMGLPSVEEIRDVAGLEGQDDVLMPTPFAKPDLKAAAAEAKAAQAKVEPPAPTKTAPEPEKPKAPEPEPKKEKVTKPKEPAKPAENVVKLPQQEVKAAKTPELPKAADTETGPVEDDPFAETAGTPSPAQEATAAEEPEQGTPNAREMVVNFLKSKNVTMEDFLDWLHGCGRMLTQLQGGGHIPFEQVPDALLKKLVDDPTNPLFKCAKIFGKP